MKKGNTLKAVLELLKTLFGYDDSELTVLLYDDRTSEETSTSFRIRPVHLKRMIYGAVVLLVGVVLGLVAFTPLQSIVVPGARPDVREEVIEISKQVQALEDTLEMREQQLQEMKKVMLQERDTTFRVSGEQPVAAMNDRTKRRPSASVQMDLFYTPIKPKDLINQEDLIQSKEVNRMPDFPVPFPVEGTLTRGVVRESGHFGVDIATTSGAPVVAIADGTVISSSWTPKYGYVIRIEHGNGYMSVYKHCLSLIYEEGDLVRKGELIGKVGDVGVLSSGPHLHFELWRKGIPLDPAQFLINNG